MAQARILLFTLGGPDGDVRWRLMSGNNWELGRSATSFTSASACLEVVRALRACPGPDAVVVARTVGVTLWRWELRYLEVPGVTSSRAFPRRIACTAAVRLFLDLFPSASIADTEVRDFSMSRTRRDT